MARCPWSHEGGSPNHQEQGGDKVTPVLPWGHPSPVWDQGEVSHSGFGAVPHSTCTLITATGKLSAGQAAALLLLLVFVLIANT